MLKLALIAGLFMSNSAFAESTADDPNRVNLEIEQAFRDINGGTIIRFAYQLDRSYGDDKKLTPNPKFVNSNMSFYCMADRCDQLSETGSGGGAVEGEMNVSFEAVDGSSGKTVTNPKTGSYQLTCNENDVRELKAISKADILALQAKLRAGSLPAYSMPDGERKAEYVFKNGTDYIYVDASKYNYSYDSFKAYIGPKGAMKEAKIKSVNRMRDGGTTLIRLEDGRVIYSPSSFKTEAKPTFDQKEIESVPRELHASLAPKQIKSKNELPAPRSPCPVPDKNPRTATSPGGSASPAKSKAQK